MNKKIILVSGDPNSINSEIIFKSWIKLPKIVRKKIFLISNFRLLKEQYKKLNYKIDLERVDSNLKIYDSDKLKIIDIKVDFEDPFNVSRKSSSKFVLNSLNLAHNLALNKNVAGIINCPIDKKLLLKNEIGVTEFLSSKCNLKNDNEVMVIKGKNLIVSPITTHLNIKSVSKKLNKKMIINKIKNINTWYKNLYKKKPQIAILGLNPHNAELRENSEERRIIIPAIKTLKKLGIFLKGPMAADTLFINDYKNFNVIVGMYHDQVLTPFKTLQKFDAINLTLGLKYPRVSPDHGVAADIVLQKKAKPESLLKCINYIHNLNS